MGFRVSGFRVQGPGGLCKTAYTALYGGLWGASGSKGEYDKCVYGAEGPSGLNLRLLYEGFLKKSSRA